MALHQPFQGPGQLEAQAFGLESLPLVETGAVSQGEATHKVSVVESDRPAEGRHASGAYLVRAVSVRLAIGQQAEKLIHVDPEGGAGSQSQALSVHLQLLVAHGPSQRGKRTA